MTAIRPIIPDHLQDLDNIAVKIFETVVTDGMLSKENVSPYLSKQPAKDINDFFPLVQTAVNDYQDRRGIVAKDRVHFVQDTPPTDAKTETITFKVKSRMPGANSGRMPEILSGNGVVREWRPRIRYWYENPERPLKRTVVFGQHYDNVVEFTCWALTNKAVDERALWFEDLMQTYFWYFKYNGVSEVIFLQRLEDKSWENIATQGNQLKSRSIQYYVRTDKTFEISESELRDILINIAVATD